MAFFRGFSSPVRQMSGSFRLPRSPNIIWRSSSIIHYGRQWPEMLTRPKASNIQIQINKWNKLSVYTTHCRLCECMQRFKKKTQGPRRCKSNSQFKIESLSISCSHANPVDFSISLPKLDKTCLYLRTIFITICFVALVILIFIKELTSDIICLEHNKY